jgi:hypothetical protein
MDSMASAMLQNYMNPSPTPMSVKEMVDCGIITLKTAKKVYNYEPNAQPKKKWIIKIKTAEN